MVLSRSQATMELAHDGAHDAVVDLAVVAGHQLIGDVHAGRHCQLLLALEVGKAGAGIVAAGQGDVLTGAQFGDGAGLEIDLAGTIGNLRLFAGYRRAAILDQGWTDESGNLCARGLAGQLGVLVGVEHAGAQEHCSGRRLTAHLPGTQRLIVVDDASSGDAGQLAQIRTEAALAGVVSIEPVRDALAEWRQFDAALRDAAGVDAERELLGLQELDLQRHGQSVFHAPGPQADEALAANQTLQHREALQAVEVEHAIRIGVMRPVAPERLQLGAQDFALAAKARHDARADLVVGQTVDGATNPRDVPVRSTGATNQQRKVVFKRRVRSVVRRVPAISTSATGRGFVGEVTDAQRPAVGTDDCGQLGDSGQPARAIHRPLLVLMRQARGRSAASETPGTVMPCAISSVLMSASA